MKNYLDFLGRINRENIYKCLNRLFTQFEINASALYNPPTEKILKNILDNKTTFINHLRYSIYFLEKYNINYQEFILSYFVTRAQLQIASYNKLSSSNISYIIVALKRNTYLETYSRFEREVLPEIFKNICKNSEERLYYSIKYDIEIEEREPISIKEDLSWELCTNE